MRELDQILLKVQEKLQIKSFNEMQKDAFDNLLNVNHALLLSHTGSGKTLAFLLPILSNISSDIEQSQAMIITPTRELAIQITQVGKSLGLGFNILSCYGGNPVRNEKKSLASSPQIIIGTPGRILDHLDRGNMNIDGIKHFVFDEFDKTLEMGFHQQVRLIIKHLKFQPQFVFTSATESVKIPDFLRISNIHRFDHLTEDVNPTLKKYLIKSETKDKIQKLIQTIEEVGDQSAFIFCNYRESAERISQFLTEKQLFNEFFHGGMDQIQRENVLSKFRNGSIRILVTTDLAGRGLDLPDVENVVHYHMPISKEIFIHRNGRTARMGKEGNCYVIYHLVEELPDYIGKDFVEMELIGSEQTLSAPKWKTIMINKGKVDKISKMDVVGFLSKVGKLNREELGMIEIKGKYALAAISNERAQEVITLTNKEKIKGKKALVRLL